MWSNTHTRTRELKGKKTLQSVRTKRKMSVLQIYQRIAKFTFLHLFALHIDHANDARQNVTQIRFLSFTVTHTQSQNCRLVICAVFPAICYAIFYMFTHTYTHAALLSGVFHKSIIYCTSFSFVSVVLVFRKNSIGFQQITHFCGF